ncbi:hypothetical protein AG1IA_04345 [Rhizoctonia solani AG-1 IA]|uniref:Uncharacterized protein n=1 Tax=Thanatephorus cucumeris (strain AG1-IA) TaxID=983506 RepID=L8WUE5_THACA|nr:hypothetical protein AG1IA_04345 [Rhizoctonia solani AG-1 IA]
MSRYRGRPQVNSPPWSVRRSSLGQSTLDTSSTTILSPLTTLPPLYKCHSHATYLWSNIAFYSTLDWTCCTGQGFSKIVPRTTSYFHLSLYLFFFHGRDNWGHHLLLRVEDLAPLNRVYDNHLMTSWINLNHATISENAPHAHILDPAFPTGS